MKLIMTLALAATMTAAAAQTLNHPHGVDVKNMDKTVKPGTDFYRYACGGWIDNNPLKPEYSRFGSFDAIAEANREQIKQLILGLKEEKHEKGNLPRRDHDPKQQREDIGELSRFPLEHHHAVPDQEKRRKEKQKAEQQKDHDPGVSCLMGQNKQPKNSPIACEQECPEKFSEVSLSAHNDHGQISGKEYDAVNQGKHSQVGQRAVPKPEIAVHCDPGTQERNQPDQQTRPGEGSVLNNSFKGILGKIH